MSYNLFDTQVRAWFIKSSTNRKFGMTISRENVYKYCRDSKESPVLCEQCFTMSENSFRKMREVYLTDIAIYIVSRNKLKLRVELDMIVVLYVALLSGEIVLNFKNAYFLIDSIDSRNELIEAIKRDSPLCRIEYINRTTLDFIFENKPQVLKKQKATKYDSNEKKVHVLNTEGQILNLTSLRAEWELRANDIPGKNKPIESQFQIVNSVLENSYWHLYRCKSKENGQLYTMKVYSKKFISAQPELLQFIWNQRRNLENLNTLFTPTLKKSFFSKSHIFLICDHYNGFLLEAFKAMKKEKMIRLLAQIVIAVGQLHEAGLVYCDLTKNGVMIESDGFVFLFNVGMSVSKGVSLTRQASLKSPEEFSKGGQKSSSVEAQFGWDWWNLGQLIFELVEERPFYGSLSSKQVEKLYESDELSDFYEMKTSRWEGEQKLLDLFKKLTNVKATQRLGYSNDYHEILHHEYFESLLKQHSKTAIMQKKCPPVVKKVVSEKGAKSGSKEVQEEWKCEDDWSEMDGYLKGYPFTRVIE